MPKAVKVKQPAVAGFAPAVKKPAPAAAKAAHFEVADNQAKKTAEVPVAQVGGQHARAAAFLSRGKINSPEAFFAKIEGLPDSQAADILGKLFADAFAGTVKKEIV
jgi:hypothetical protein